MAAVSLKKKLRENDIRRRHGVNILAIRSSDGKLDPMPDADDVFHEGDHMFVMGEENAVLKLSK